MGIMGSLETMALPEIFQWTRHTQKTGILRVTRGKTSVLIHIKEGRIAGTSSNDPPSLLGQFLISRGKITEETLHEALERQEATRRPLGEILRQMRVVTAGELERLCVAKAEETLLDMLEWSKAVFEFDEQARPGPRMVKMDHDVEDLLTDMPKRQQETEQMREVLGGPGAVFCRTGKELDSALAETGMNERVYRAIDGKRTLAQIVLHTRASEYPVMQSMLELRREEFIRVEAVQEVAPATGSPEATFELVGRVLARGEYELALDMLANAVHERPGDTRLRELLTKTESEYLRRIYGSDLPPSAVPVALTPRDRLAEAKGLEAAELFVMDMIDASKWDVKSLIRLSPMHELDVVRALVRLRTEGHIELSAAPPRTVDQPVEVRAEELTQLITNTDHSGSIDDSLEQSIGKGATSGRR